PRSPPPTSFNWTPAPLSINYRDLPPLPAILDPKLARQAVASKDFLIYSKDSSDLEIYDYEIASYRTLEWLGDGKLHQAYSEGLSRLLPSFGAGVLSIMRDQIETNSAQSYVGWYYELDRNLLEPPPPSKPRQGWRPLAQSQKVVSDLFEAHMGGLVKEGRQHQIDHWIDQLLEKNAAEIKSRANALELEQRQKSRETRGEMRKRSREENAFEEGREIDPATKLRRASLLTQCPVEIQQTGEIPRWRWDDRTDADGKWHSHFVSGNTTIACGRGQKQTSAHDATIVNLLESLSMNEPLRRHLLGTSTPPTRTRYHVRRQ
ncbi:hypothetical protein JCM5353_006651, partial [Sporobolomyces roseus]